MECARCRSENPASRKFCGECGALLAASCSRCGAANSATQKYCGECGVRLEPGVPAERFGSPRGYTPAHLAERILTSRAALEGERKQVTVLFCDLAGSTALAARLGPEALHAVLITLGGSRRRPLIVAVEDLHWIDKTSEEYFATAVESLPGAPIFLVTTYRPGFRPPWMDKSYMTQVALRPLSLEQSLSIVRADLAAPITQLIVSKAEGNPFFLEELTRAVVEHGEGEPGRAFPRPCRAC